MAAAPCRSPRASASTSEHLPARGHRVQVARGPPVDTPEAAAENLELHEVTGNAGGDEGLRYNVGLAASALAGDQEFPNRCEQNTCELARNSIRINTGDLLRVGW